MDKKEKAIASMLVSLYYMMGLVEASGCKSNYDFVLEAMSDAESILFGEGL